ncbi:MAG: hypothetical protein OEV55_04025, partial [candidate division Zixibacteria bacterium]|nr:hypothetical protein [candidate division Zixibacteria bacterium]
MNNFKYFILISLLSLVLILSCASKKVLSNESEFRIPLKSEVNSSIPPELELHPEIEGENQKNKLFSFSARETPLEDILVYITSEAGLNLSWDKGVNPRVLVTVSFQNQTLDEAL